MEKHKYLVYVILIISLGSSLYFSHFILEKVWLLFVISGFISFFYVWEIPGLKGKNIRDIPGIKIYIIAVVWVLITVAVPYLVDTNIDLKKMLILFFAEVLFMISITIPFDIRDMYLDEPSKKTIPQLIGIKNSIYISITLLLISQILMQYLLPSINIGIILITLITIPVLFYSKPSRHDLYYSGLTDALLILQPILLYLFNF